MRSEVRAISSTRAHPDTGVSGDPLDRVKGDGREALLAEFGDAFAGRPALVTGADGFLGSQLVDGLVELGSEVHAVVRASSRTSLRNIATDADRLTVHPVDLTDYEAVLGAVSAVSELQRPVYVFHLGAQVHVRESWRRPYETVLVSAMGTLNLVDALMQTGCPVEKVDVAGTSEVYGPVDPERRDQYRIDDDGCVILDETAPLNPGSIYATAQLTANFLALNYHEAYGLPCLVARTFHNFGPRQTPQTVTGNVIARALVGDPIVLGPVAPRRDFSFSLDTIRARLHLALRGRAGEVYCLGRGECVSIGDWAQLIVRIGAEAGYWHDQVIATNEDDARPGGQQDAIRADTTKIRAETVWRPTVEPAEALRRTIAWYASNPDRWLDRVDGIADTAAAKAGVDAARRRAEARA